MFGNRKKKPSSDDDPLFEQPLNTGHGIVISEEPALKRGEPGDARADDAAKGAAPADAGQSDTVAPAGDDVAPEKPAADLQQQAPPPPAEELPPVLDDEDLAGLDFIFAQADDTPSQADDFSTYSEAPSGDTGDDGAHPQDAQSAPEEPLNTAMPIAWSDLQGDGEDEPKEEAIDFSNLLKDTDASDETPSQKRRRLRAEAKAKAKAEKAAAYENTGDDGKTDGTGEASGTDARDQAHDAQTQTVPPKTRKTVRTVLVISAASVVFALLITGFLALRTKEVVFRNLTYYNADDIVQACGIEKNDLLPLFQKNAFSDTISTEFPFIRSVSASVKLPGTLVLTMEEDAPAYYTVIHDEYFLISSNQRVLGRYKTREELPDGVKELLTSRIFYAVVGYPLAFFEPTYSAYLAKTLLTLEESDIFPELTKIDITYRYDIDLYCSDSLLIEIGSATDLSPKLQFVNSILSDLEEGANGTIHIIDVKTASVRLSAASQPTA